MIKGIVKGLVLGGLAVAILASPAHAQKPKVEYGFGMAAFSMNNPSGSGNNNTTFGFGGGNVSGAMYLNEQIALEPTLTYNYSKAEGASDATTALGLRVAVPIYLNKGWGRMGGLFVAPHVGIMRTSVAGASTSRTDFGASVGTKIKITSDVFWRVQGTFDTGPKKDLAPKYTNLGAFFGLSLYMN